MIDQKDDEIRRLNSQIDDAEQELHRIDREGKQKTAELEEEIANLEHELANAQKVSDQEILDLQTKQKQELIQLKQRQETELTSLRQELQLALEESEKFAGPQKSQIREENDRKVRNLKTEVKNLQTSATDLMLSVPEQNDDRVRKAQATADEFSQRVQELELELNRLTAERRIELQKANQALGEALKSLDARERASREIAAQYKRELKAREQDHNARMEDLQRKFEFEKNAMETELGEAAAKAERMEQMYAQIERHNKQQLEATLKEIEDLKISIQETRAANEQQLAIERKEKRKLKRAQRESAAGRQEQQFVVAEIARMRSENQDLRQELKRLDQLVYDSNARPKDG
jgi:myosin heavy subunit